MIQICPHNPNQSKISIPYRNWLLGGRSAIALFRNGFSKALSPTLIVLGWGEGVISVSLSVMFLTLRKRVKFARPKSWHGK